MTQQTAQGLAALGRGPDSMLVHMAPGEVQSLQALAQRHGGSLTINPQTGLPEAGFLSSILPMVIGAGLMAATGGAAAPALFGMSNAAAIGLGVGGLQALRTGSLSKGLMAGLGAYGGAGLGAGLGAAGMESAANTQLAGDAAYKTAQEAMQQQATALGQNALPYTPEGFAAQARDLTAPLNTMQNAALANQQAAMASGSFGQNLGTMGSGLSNLGSEAGRGAFMQEVGGGSGLMQKGLMAAAPVLAQGSNELNAPGQTPSMIRPYTYSREKIPSAFQDVAGAPMSSKERRYFTDTFVPGTPYKAPGPEYLAAGGPVEEMSNENVLGANTGYPMADIHTGAYATPYQQPMSQNVVQGSQDAAVNPYTGQATFADGGSVGGYTYDPASGTYVKAGGQGATTVTPEGFQSTASGINPGAPTVSDVEMASYYGNNPGMGALSRGMQGLFGTSVLGAIQNAVSPSFQAQQNAITYGYAPSAYDDPGTAVAADAEAAANAGGYGTGDSAGFGGGTEGGGDGYAQGGISNLGDYSDGGRLLRGPGDGISDNIPAVIGKKRPARLADGEFVVPARIVSELGNGSTEAGARKLYAMMERVQKARGKTVGKGKVAANSRASKHLPA